MIESTEIEWPQKHDLFGVQVSAADYVSASEAIMAAARRRVPAVASLHAVHALVTAAGDAELRQAVNTFELIGTDGQPVRWALNLLHRAGLKDRVYGPELMLRLCRRAAEDGVSVYLYGSMPDVLDDLQSSLRKSFPGLQIAGAESPPFRPLTPDEDEAVVQRINRSGAGIVFIGLGAPKQDRFAFDHRRQIQAVQVCVGAAFDFHAGHKPMAPRWMQRTGLEWLFRLGSEPTRLARRYLVTNTVFLAKLAVQFARKHARIETVGT